MAAPLLNWDDTKVWDYFKKHNIPRSPSYAYLSLSGDCNCGAFSDAEDIHIYEAVYPDVAEHIKSIQKKLAVCPNLHKGHETWGNDRKRKKPKPSIPSENAICSECSFRVTEKDLK